jgi:hypothetical protein
MGTGGRPKELWMDGVSLTDHGLREEDTRGRDMWRNLVWGERCHCTVEKFFNE